MAATALAATLSTPFSESHLVISSIARLGRAGCVGVVSEHQPW